MHIMGTRWDRRSAFTLTELLVVIGIILILISILFPFGRRMYARAKTAQCLANLKSWGVALNGYMIETGMMPADGGSGLPDLNKSNAWYNVLPPRFDGLTLSNFNANGSMPRPGGTKMETAFFCPEFRVEDITSGTPADTDPVFSYGYNYWIDLEDRSESQNTDYYIPNGLMRIDDIHSPADFVVFGEAAKFQSDVMTAADIRYRHDSGTAANLAFADGSVRTFTTNDLYVAASEDTDINRSVIWDPQGDPESAP